MEHIEVLTIAYECEASLGSSLNLKDMTKDFLRIFSKKTSAIYGAIVEINEPNTLSLLNSVGKNEFLHEILRHNHMCTKNYITKEIVKDKTSYKILFIALKGYYLAFVYHDDNRLDINTIANIFISLRKKIELGLKASIEHERNVLALLGTNDGLWDFNVEEKSIYFSPRWKEMIGYKYDELPNSISIFKKLLHPDDFTRSYKNILSNLKGKTDYYENIYRMKHKDGRWLWMIDKGKTYFDELGKPIRMIGTHRDITKEKEMQLKFAHQAQIIEQIHEAVISTDLDGNIVSWNKGSKLLLGYDASDVLGKHIFTFIHDEKDKQNIDKALEILKKHGKHQGNIKLVKKSNEIIDVSISLSFLKDESDSTIGIVGYARDITKEVQTKKRFLKQQEKLQHQAFHDPLTGVANRSLFYDRLIKCLNKSKRNKSKIALFFIDLDHFKEINDSLGHDIGDIVLQTITKRIKNIIRLEDTIARLAGDEFTIIMESLKKNEDASVLAKKILDSIREPIYAHTHSINISASIGISLYPDDATTHQTLLKYADIAMYKAKKRGKNNFQFYSPSMTKFAFERIAMEANIRQAIKDEEFILHYQPQIDIKENKISSVEALIRWRHPNIGMLHPDKFIQLAEETGLIADIDKWVMQTAMKQMASWKNMGINIEKLTLNLSSKYLNDENFVFNLKESLKENTFKAKNLRLEITENQVMTNKEKVLKQLKNINNLGVKITIDSFGAGYSSLSYLQQLHVSALKIDKTFIKTLPEDKDNADIIKAIISLAKALKLDVIAKDVETNQQKNFLLEKGCYHMQGYLFSRALSPCELETYYKDFECQHH